MGRTNATYRDLLRALQERWGTYRRGLRREDQVHFDRLFTHARNYADASGLQNHEDPVVPVLVSIALAQEKHLAALDARIEALEAAIEIPGGSAGVGNVAETENMPETGNSAASGNMPEPGNSAASGNMPETENTAGSGNQPE